MRTTRRVLASLLAVMSLAGPAPAFAKLLSLELRCPCTRPSRQWLGHAAYVRCVKRNAPRYLRLEAQLDRMRGGPRRSHAELRAAARARVAEASASRCGYESYRCDLRTRPCPPGETCDVRMCDLTAGVCVPTPAACPTDGAPRCTCVSEADPFGLAYANDCERLRAGAVLDVFRNPPFQICDPSCGGPDRLACAPPRTCIYPWGACSTLTQHGRCVEAREACPGPVCGCDGITYATECGADRAGVLVAYGGTCGTQCGGPPSFTCPPGLECLKAEASNPPVLFLETEDHLQRLAPPTSREQQHDRLVLEIDALDAHGAGPGLRRPLIVAVDHHDGRTPTQDTGDASFRRTALAESRTAGSTSSRKRSAQRDRAGLRANSPAGCPSPVCRRCRPAWMFRVVRAW